MDPDKLLALNHDHIQAASARDLVQPLTPFLAAENIDIDDTSFAEKVITTLQPRSKTLKDMAQAAVFYYCDDITYEEKAAKKFLKAGALEPLNVLTTKLETAADFSEKGLEQIFGAVMAETGLKLGKIAQPVRVALTGRTASPGIFEIVSILGREKVVQRLKKAVEFIEEKQES